MIESHDYALIGLIVIVGGCAIMVARIKLARIDRREVEASIGNG